MFQINSLHLANFRGITERKLEFSPGINLIYGENAVGKTTLLEAISCLSVCQSFRAAKDVELIQYGKPYCFAKAAVLDETGEHELVFSVSPNGKMIQKDGKVYSKLSRYIGYFKLVIFSPQDLLLIQGSPSNRRRFMDLALSQTDPKYLDTLIQYRKWLKERNELLKEAPERIDRALLKIITSRLIPLGLTITKKRRWLVNSLNPMLKTNLSMLKDGENAELIYRPDIVDEEHLDYYYESTIERDILTQSTHIGPQKDDLDVMLSGKKAVTFASQGQQRSIVLALKAAEADMFRETNDHIIIALDDVFSELDEERQEAVLSLVEKGPQVFLTTTQEDIATKLVGTQVRRIKMEKGEVIYG